MRYNSAVRRKEVHLMASALVTNIQGYSIHDGDGIRTVVFLKGCPLRCKWCANPENLEAKPHVGFLSNLCTGCGRCAKFCPHDAIVPGSDVYRINLDRCVHCGKCAEACFYGALVSYGSEMTSQQVFDKVRRDKMFYESSGGGVTVSGGEPLTHPDFVEELFTLCKGDGISTCVETCGCVPQSTLERVFPLTDQFYFDIKSINDEIHKKYTGVSNEQILKNAQYLVSRGANILFRQPLIPGVNSTPEQIESTAEFLNSLGGEQRLQLMPYHRMGISKYAALNKPYEMEQTPVMSQQELSEIESRFCALGIRCDISR